MLWDGKIKTFHTIKVVLESTVYFIDPKLLENMFLKLWRYGSFNCVL